MNISACQSVKCVLIIENIYQQDVPSGHRDIDSRMHPSPEGSGCIRNKVSASLLHVGGVFLYSVFNQPCLVFISKTDGWMMFFLIYDVIFYCFYLPIAAWKACISFFPSVPWWDYSKWFDVFDVSCLMIFITSEWGYFGGKLARMCIWSGIPLIRWT